MGVAADILGLPTSAAVVLRGLLTAAIAEGIKVTAWAKGSPTRAVYRSMGDFGKAIIDAVADIADQGILEAASGAALTILARNVYGITRAEATFATTTLLIDNAGGGEYPYSPDNPLILTSSITKKQYISQGTGTILGLTSGQSLSVQAQEAGSASTALPGEIDEWVSSVDALTINHPTAAVGSNETSDADLKTACRARVGFVPTESTIGAGGAPGAYESVARGGPDGGGGVVRPDGTRIAVTRVRVEPDGGGGVEVIVADEDGPITAPDLALVESAVITYAKPVGVPVAVSNSVALAISCTLTVWIGASTTATDDEVKAAITAAIVAYFQAVKIGGYDLGSGGIVPLRGGLEDAATDGAKTAAALIKLVFATPSGDTATATNEVPSLSGTPTITVNRVAGS
jgi:hypothetical protein